MRVGRLSVVAAFLLFAAAAPRAKDAGGGAPAAPEDGGPRNWEVAGGTSALNLLEEPSEAARVVARYAPGRILDNLGCRPGEGGAGCDVQELGGGPWGYATVMVKRRDGRTRTIFFRMGRPIGTDTSQVDPGKLCAQREGDLHVIRVGDERYEIPGAMVLGGSCGSTVPEGAIRPSFLLREDSD
jgi:hypothetical protein